MKIHLSRLPYVMLFCGCLGMPMTSLSYGESTTNGRPPLAQEFGLKPGAYDLVITVSQPIVDPGDRLRVEVYISGYGVIQAAKVAFYPSPDVFHVDPNESVVKGGIKQYSAGRMGWGEKAEGLNPTGMVLTCSGGFVPESNPSWQEPSWFFDANERQIDNYQISTEVKLPEGTSPLYLDLTVRGETTPGPHSIQFVLTYFDGQTWKTASKNADFTIRNVYQRYEWWIARIGVLAAIATIGPMLRWPLLLWRRFRRIPAVSPAGNQSPARREVISKNKNCSRGR